MQTREFKNLVQTINQYLADVNPIIIRIAEGLCLQKRVTAVRQQHVTDDELGMYTVFEATVRPTRSDSYDIIVWFDKDGIEAECDCHRGEICEHAAAALFQIRKKYGENLPLRVEQDVKTLSAPKAGPASAKIVRRPDSSGQVQLQLESLKKIIYGVDKVTSYRRTSIADADEKFSVVYLLKHPPHNSTAINLEANLSRYLKSGKLGNPKKYNFNSDTAKEWQLPNDEAILFWLSAIEHRQLFSSRDEFNNLYAEEMLVRVIQTQRCYYDSLAQGPLILKNEMPLNLQWQQHDGKYRLQTCINDEPIEIFFMVQAWYLTKENQVGKLTTTIPPLILRKLLELAPLNLEQVRNLHESLKDKLDKWQIPSLAKVFTKIEQRTVKPQPCIRLLTVDMVHMMEQNNKKDCNLIELSFNYDGTKILWDEKDAVIYKLHNEKCVAYKRDTKSEAQAVAALTDIGLSTVNSRRNLQWLNHDKYVNHFYIHEEPSEFVEIFIPQLKAQGFQVEYARTFHHVVLNVEQGAWYGEIQEDEGSSWFTLELGIELDGEKINLLPILQAALERFNDDPALLKEIKNKPQEFFSVPLADNRLLKIRNDRLKSMYDILVELQNKQALDENAQLKLARSQAGLLLELQKALAVNEVRWLGHERLQKLAERLQNFQGIQEIQVPEIFQGQLRAYQQQGLNWLQFLREYNLAGILADEMGLGKTVQVLAHLACEKAAGRLSQPCLIVAPTSLMYNWQHEVEQFAPALKVLILQGKLRKEKFDQLQQYDLILTTYPLLFRDKDILLTHSYYYLILDESQMVKNNKTQAAAVVNQLDVQHRLCMTGTPLENHLSELWSMFNFLMPGLLGSDRDFKRWYRTPVEKQNDQERLQQLRARTAPFILRRTKKLVATELPDKTEIIHYVELDTAQRDLYETVRLQMQQKIEQFVQQQGMGRSHIVILDALLKMRQICCDPELLKVNKTQAYPSAKLTALLQLIDKQLEEKHSILLFSQFTEMLAIIEKAITLKKIPYVKLTGSTEDRITPIQQFQSGAVSLFLISLKAGGVGLNLTAADTVIHYDPWWNPAVEQQATDRAHRIGQLKQVFVYKLIAAGTIEEKILHLQQRKKILLENLFTQNDQQMNKLNADDLQFLFEGLPESGADE